MVLWWSVVGEDRTDTLLGCINTDVRKTLQRNSVGYSQSFFSPPKEYLAEWQ